MTTQDLVNKLRSIPKGSFVVRFAFPYIQACLTHEQFLGKSDEEREAAVADWLGTSVGELRTVGNGSLITFHWIAPGEKPFIPERGDHWVYGATRSPVAPRDIEGPTVIHFFGYKGGQARTSVLAVLAQTLAESGLRVLMIDADLEAPSLPAIVGKQPRLAASTLLGLYNSPTSIPLPIPCAGASSGGKADLISARLPEESVDWEYDAFTMRALFDPTVVSALGSRLGKFAADKDYHVVFVDQRTGSSPATLNWFDSLPGGYCIFARLDHQWEAGKRFYRTLARLSPSYSAAIVSFKPDEENPTTFRSRNAGQIGELSRIVEDAFLEKLPYSEDADPADGVADLDRWVLWPYDQSFRLSACPATSEIGHLTRLALDRISLLLNLPDPPAKKVLAAETTKFFGHQSGSLDASTLIETEVLRELLQPNSSINYIFGRKGTGKSRLFTALAERGSFALVADDQFEGSDGLRSHEVKDFTAKGDVQGLWWKVLVAALSFGSRKEELRKFTTLEGVQSANDVRLVLSQTAERRIFLIDGLETAFGPSQIERYVSEVFEMMRVVQADPELREKIEIKLFLRTDLQQRANVQNLEQQIHGRVRWLSWDLQSILNFMLSRIASPNATLFAQKFSDEVAAIKVRENDIRNAVVSVEEAFALLLPIFPDRVRRVNAKMQTFIELHFADSSSEGGRYYPRFVQSFLDKITQADQRTSSDSPFRGDVLDEEGRLTSGVVQYAYDEAAKQFLGEVRQELGFVLLLQPEKIDPLLQSFAGRATPFYIEEMVSELATRLSLPVDEVRDALDRLKSLGIFELRPGFEKSEWRAGRIFRSALRMKLRR